MFRAPQQTHQEEEWVGVVDGSYIKLFFFFSISNEEHVPSHKEIKNILELREGNIATKLPQNTEGPETCWKIEEVNSFISQIEEVNSSVLLLSLTHTHKVIVESKKSES